MRRTSLVSGSLLLLAAGFLAGCGDTNPKRIRMQVMDIGKVTLKVSKGEKLAWSDQNNNAVGVTFQHGVSPCEETGATLKECTVKVVKGLYSYTCPICKDPVLAVGTDVGPLGGGEKAGIASAPDADPPTPEIFCSDPTKPVSVDPIKGNAGDRFQWIGLGVEAATWQITLPDGTCNEGTAFDQDHSVCTIKTTQAQLTYSVRAPGCAMPNGTGSLTVPK